MKCLVVELFFLFFWLLGMCITMTLIYMVMEYELLYYIAMVLAIFPPELTGRPSSPVERCAEQGALVMYFIMKVKVMFKKFVKVCE